MTNHKSDRQTQPDTTEEQLKPRHGILEVFAQLPQEGVCEQYYQENKAKRKEANTKCRRNLGRLLVGERLLRRGARKVLLLLVLVGERKKMRERRLYKLWYVILLHLDCLAAANPKQILADSFETRFSPFTLEVPRVSLPQRRSELY